MVAGNRGSVEMEKQTGRESIEEERLSRALKQRKQRRQAAAGATGGTHSLLIGVRVCLCLDWFDAQVNSPT